jgi:hypothetical protein
MLEGSIMKNWHVEFVFELPEEIDRDFLEGHIESVLEVLDDLDGVVDADSTINYVDRKLTIYVGTEPFDDPLTVLSSTVPALRTAIHSAGGSTPGWEGLLKDMMQSLRLAVHHEGELVEF